MGFQRLQTLAFVFGQHVVVTALPEDWRRVSITPIITAKAVWFMQGAVGVTYEVTDCSITDDLGMPLLILMFYNVFDLRGAV